MAKRQTDLDREIEDLTKNWIALNRVQDAVEWGCWTAWREREMHTHARPDNLTVPTPFPPMTVQSATDYLDIVRKIRKANGWGNSRGRLTKDPKAWMPTDRGIGQ